MSDLIHSESRLGTAGPFAPAGDSRAFRDAMGLFATGVTVVTVDTGSTRHGMTANAVMSVSLDPPLLALAIHRDAFTNELIRTAGHFAICVLGSDTGELALEFATPMAREADLFDGDESASPLGDPLVPGAIAHLACQVHSIHEEGDHSVFIGEVVHLARTTKIEAQPLIFFSGGFGDFRATLGDS